MIDRSKDTPRHWFKCNGGMEGHVLIPLVRTPKSQPDVEQPLTGECLNPLKKTKTKERLQW